MLPFVSDDVESVDDGIWSSRPAFITACCAIDFKDDISSDNTS
jgi:hypothetical protein